MILVRGTARVKITIEPRQTAREGAYVKDPEIAALPYLQAGPEKQTSLQTIG